MKKIMTALLVLLLLAALVVPTSAATLPRLVDDADLLSDGEETALLSELDRISVKYSFDIVVVTVADYTDYSYDIDEFSCDVYDQYGYGFGPGGDGVILVISMAERDWVITSTGSGEKIVNSDARNYLSDAFIPDLSSGRYYSAFRTFASMTEDLLEDAENGIYYKAPFNTPLAVFAAVVIGLIVAAIYTGKLKGELKSVSFQRAASAYVDRFNVTAANEFFLYSNVMRTVRQTSSGSGHSGSSGHSHSSSHGKF